MSKFENDMEGLLLELVTLKVMVASLAKTFTSNKKILDRWEKDCRKEAKRLLKENIEMEGK